MELEQTFGLVRPEALERGLLDDIIKRIEDAGLVVEEQKEGIMPQLLFEIVYGCRRHQESYVGSENRRFYEYPVYHDDHREYLTSNPVVALRVSGEDAVKRLLAVRGADNPVHSLPGTIRGDYAADQDYNVLSRPRHVPLSREQLERVDKDQYGSLERQLEKYETDLTYNVQPQVGVVPMEVFYASPSAEQVKKEFEFFFGIEPWPIASSWWPAYDTHCRWQCGPDHDAIQWNSWETVGSPWRGDRNEKDEETGKTS